MAFKKTGAPEKQKPIISDDVEQTEYFCIGFDDDELKETEEDDALEEEADSG